MIFVLAFSRSFCLVSFAYLSLFVLGSSGSEREKEIEAENLQLLGNGLGLRDFVSPEQKISGGACAPKGKYPFMVSVQTYHQNGNYWKHSCGGTIIDSCNVLTAAHCCEPAMYRIVAGIYSAKIELNEPTKQIRNVKKTVIPMRYPQSPMGLDICILHLDTALRLGKMVKPVKLPGNGDMGPTTTSFNCFNLGWGRTVADIDRPDKPVPCLKTVNLTAYGAPACRLRYRLTGLADTEICAVNPKLYTGVCTGDSGGPLMCPANGGGKYQAGVVSRGPAPCGDPQQPVIFTNLFPFLNTFIRPNLQTKCLKPRRHSTNSKFNNTFYIFPKNVSQ